MTVSISEDLLSANVYTLTLIKHDKEFLIEDYEVNTTFRVIRRT